MGLDLMPSGPEALLALNLLISHPKHCEGQGVAWRHSDAFLRLEIYLVFNPMFALTTGCVVNVIRHKIGYRMAPQGDSYEDEKGEEKVEVFHVYY